MWAQLRRSGIEVARCTLQRIMRDNRWRGVMRAANVRTTVADPTEDALKANSTARSTVTPDSTPQASSGGTYTRSRRP